jgi:hypothetical protein
VAQHVVKEPCLLVYFAVTGHAPLQEPPATQKGDHCHQSDHAPTLLHICLRSRRIADTFYPQSVRGPHTDARLEKEDQLGPDG